MPDDDALSDNEAHDKLLNARKALGETPGRSTRARTALDAARQALTRLALALLYASERGEDEIKGVSRKEADE